MKHPLNARYRRIIVYMNIVGFILVEAIFIYYLQFGRFSWLNFIAGILNLFTVVICERFIPKQ